MKASLPSTAGAWPAFWLIPADGSWPPELDVMETLTGSSTLDYTTAHSEAGGYHSAVGAANLVTDVGGYHTYGVLWTPTELTWYLDGQEVFQTATPADMNKPMYMIANLAVGGFGGQPDGWQTADMQIDYIHAYALPGHAGGTGSAAIVGGLAPAPSGAAVPSMPGALPASALAALLDFFHGM
jgi:beta-glucanase (GH16 family)